MIHTLFPLAVGEYYNKKHDYFRRIFLDDLHKYFVRESDGGITSGEVTGINDVHTHCEYEPLFQFISDRVREHFSTLNFHHEIFDVIFTKTWVNVLDNSLSFPGHIHDTSHYSFVYYVDTPQNSDLLCFSVKENPNQPFSGAFFDHGATAKVNTLISEYNVLNSSCWRFPVDGGKLFIFPSHLLHWTEKVGMMSASSLRVSIAGDIFLIYKQEHNPAYPTGIFPVTQWKTFKQTQSI